MKIQGIVREIYGNRRAYCTNQAQELSIIKLTGKKTLTDSTVAALRELGATIDIFDPYSVRDKNKVGVRAGEVKQD